ncbi:MAG: Wzz/FepE/Etk N-terminal domain-containing protein [Candidatus Acidiferrales bacterium]
MASKNLSGEAVTMTRQSPGREDVVLVPSPSHEMPGLGDDFDSPEDPQRAADRVRLLWDHRRFLLRIAAIGLAVSLAIALLIPSQYQSTTQLMPPDQGGSMAMLAALADKSGAGGAGELMGGLAGDMLGLKNTGELFTGILASRTVQDDIVKKFDLQKVYHKRHLEDARRELGVNTAIGQDRKSGILTVMVTDESPQRAAAMAQEYVAALNRVVVDLNTSSAHRERVFLEDRLVQVKQDLESAEKNFSQFASKNEAVDIQTQGKAMIEAAATLEGQLIAAETELESLRQIYSDGNVRVRATQARVDELRRQLQKLGGRGAAQNGTSAASQADASSLVPSLRELPLLGVNYADLFRSMKVQEAIFDTLTQEYELAKVEEAKETPSVKVLDPPNIPERKSSPHRALITLGGGLLALALGIVWIFGETEWRSADPGDPRKALAQEIFDDLAQHCSRLVRRVRPSAPSETAFQENDERRNE